MRCLVTRIEILTPVTSLTVASVLMPSRRHNLDDMPALLNLRFARSTYEHFHRMLKSSDYSSAQRSMLDRE